MLGSLKSSMSTTELIKTPFQLSKNFLRSHENLKSQQKAQKIKNIEIWGKLKKSSSKYALKITKPKKLKKHKIEVFYDLILDAEM
jgi:hypothetical protein